MRPFIEDIEDVQYLYEFEALIEMPEKSKRILRYLGIPVEEEAMVPVDWICFSKN